MKQCFIFGFSVCFAFACSGVPSNTLDGGVTINAGGNSSINMDQTGGSSAIVVTSTGGNTSTTGGASSAITSATGGSAATGGASATGGETSTDVGATGVTSCSYIKTGTNPMCAVKLMYVGGTSLGSAKVTFYGNCGSDKNSLSGWSPICSNVQCSSEGVCICNTTLQKANWLQTNVGLPNFLWAIGEQVNTALCPNDYDPNTRFCNGMQATSIRGDYYVNGQMMTISNAVKNPQNNGDNFLVQIVDC